MRNNLLNYKDESLFVAVLTNKIVKKTSSNVYLIKDIKDNNGKYVTNHLYANPKTTISRKLNKKYKNGDKVTFMGKVREYTRKNGTKDYELEILQIIENM